MFISYRPLPNPRLRNATNPKTRIAMRNTRKVPDFESPLGTESFVASLAQIKAPIARGTIRSRSPKSILRRYSFLGWMFTPSTFPNLLSPIRPGSLGLNPFTTDLDRIRVEPSGYVGWE